MFSREQKLSHTFLCNFLFEEINNINFVSLEDPKLFLESASADLKFITFLLVSVNTCEIELFHLGH